eukprot:scaffold186267_cov31-Tisochrysis_lutea.AAC.3
MRRQHACIKSKPKLSAECARHSWTESKTRSVKRHLVGAGSSSPQSSKSIFSSSFSLSEPAVAAQSADGDAIEGLEREWTCHVTRCEEEREGIALAGVPFVLHVSPRAPGPLEALNVARSSCMLYVLCTQRPSASQTTHILY